MDKKITAWKMPVAIIVALLVWQVLIQNISQDTYWIALSILLVGVAINRLADVIEGRDRAGE